MTSVVIRVDVDFVRKSCMNCTMHITLFTNFLFLEKKLFLLYSALKIHHLRGFFSEIKSVSKIQKSKYKNKSTENGEHFKDFQIFSKIHTKIRTMRDRTGRGKISTTRPKNPYGWSP